MFYGILDEGFFNRNKNNNFYTSNLNADKEVNDIKSHVEKYKQLNDKLKSASKPREY
jgi:hypothetical protein